MKIVNIHQAKTNLSKLLREVARGQEVLIGKAGKPVAKLIPFTKPAKKRTGGQLKGEIKMSPDFDQLPKEFWQYFTKEN